MPVMAEPEPKPPRQDAPPRGHVDLGDAVLTFKGDTSELDKSLDEIAKRRVELQKSIDETIERLKRALAAFEAEWGGTPPQQ
jgi:hypothetical protein